MRYTFITGVSRGLGASLCSQLQESSDEKLIGFSRSRGDFQGDFHTCDLTKPQLLEQIVEAAMDALDLSAATQIVFVNNAGQLGPIDFIHRLDAMDIQGNISANLISSSLFLSLFIRYTKDLSIPKTFVNITSGAALADRAKPGWSLYCASKAAQEQIVRSVALEQAHEPNPTKIINFNPGIMETQMQQLIRKTPQSNFPGVTRFIELYREGKVGAPEAIARKLLSALSQTDALDNGKTYQHSDFNETL